ncbi:MAG: hydrogenase maturation protease [Thermodesulfobacteriota bacterium]
MSTSETRPCWIVGFGNRARRDDGIGPYVVERLKGEAAHRQGVHLLALPQLRADLAEDLRAAERFVFVDATVETPAGGRRWRRLYPQMRTLPYLTHHVDPAFLLGLIETLYGRAPSAWLVSINGSDFGFGEGFSPEVVRTADRVCREISGFICRSRETIMDSVRAPAMDAFRAAKNSPAGERKVNL